MLAGQEAQHPNNRALGRAVKEKQRFWADRNSWKHGEADVQGILTWCGYVGFLGPCRNACTPLSALERTREDSATALGRVQGQLVKGEDLAPWP